LGLIDPIVRQSFSFLCVVSSIFWSHHIKDCLYSTSLLLTLFKIICRLTWELNSHLSKFALPYAGVLF
jgi:hypothetical protein